MPQKKHLMSFRRDYIRLNQHYHEFENELERMRISLLSYSASQLQEYYITISDMLNCDLEN